MATITNQLKAVMSGDLKMSILFEPTKIGRMEIRNRIVRSATYDGSAGRTGAVSDKQIAICTELAEHEVGLIITGIAYVHKSGQISGFQNSLASNEMIPSFRMLVEAVHQKGGSIAVQLFHAGRERGKFTRVKGDALGPSVIENDPYFAQSNRAMGEGEIWEIIEAFGNAARRARESGFDAVQVHGAHAYLLAQFLSPYTNRRTDQWGGSFENRLRLHGEIYRNIKAKVGNDYPVLLKLGVEDGFPGGLTFEEGKKAAHLLARSGYDALEVSSGLRGLGYEKAEFRTKITSRGREAYFRDWCADIKKTVQVPVMMVGGLRSIELMEEVVQKGEADFVSLSRPLIREPALITRWRNGSRRKAACISCNRCFENLLKGGEFGCTVLSQGKSGDDKRRGDGH
jgi:2,4-dienoyl-CoA reductase-like NADH-dependent reductase (Old Yellow Enzyme family)